MDAYFRGTGDDEKFSRAVRTQNNKLVAASASGRSLGDAKSLKLRSRELAPMLDEFNALPESMRKPKLGPPGSVRKRLPDPPKGAMIVRGHCSYLKRDEGGKLQRHEMFYFKRNPDRWKAETQTDVMWLREKEWRALVPKSVKVGDRFPINKKIQQRFYSTMAIDFMEGSVNSLPVRSSTMEIKVVQADKDGVWMQMFGSGKMGTTLKKHDREAENSRGCEIQIVGMLHRKPDGAFDRFDIVGVGTGWGNKNHFDPSYMDNERYPWTYGIACELVTTRRPIDKIPPYNLLHYNQSGKKYFGDE